jgi:hypothetical protein
MDSYTFFRLRGLSLDKNTVSQSGSFFSRGYGGYGEPFIPGTLMSQRFFFSERSFYVFFQFGSIQLTAFRFNVPPFMAQRLRSACHVLFGRSSFVQRLPDRGYA